MAKGLVSDTNLTAIANAIRAKNGSSDTYTPATMATAITNIPTSQVDETTALQYMLNNKTDYTGIAAGLTTLTELPEFTQPSGVKDFYGAFSNCRSLERIEHLDVSSSNSSFERMFYYCQNLSYVPDLSTIGSGARSASRMFYYCQNLQNLPALQWTSFNSCSSMLVRVPISVFDQVISTNALVSQIGDFSSMFYGCTNLTTVILRSRGFYSTVSFSSMFSGCTNLTTVEFLNHPDAPSSTQMIKPTIEVSCKEMFNGCTALSSVSQSVIDCVLVSGVTKTNTSMFSGCTNLTTAPVIGTRMDSVVNCAQMFLNCKNLVDLGQMDLSSVNSGNYSSSGYGMQRMFKGCSALSNTSLNNILASLLTATGVTSNKNLKYIGLTSAQATTCTGLSNWSALSAAGWTTGY